jgi:hypothetical protein
MKANDAMAIVLLSEASNELQQGLNGLSRRKKGKEREKLKRVRAFLNDAKQSIKVKDWASSQITASNHQGIAEKVRGKGRHIESAIRFEYVPIAPESIAMLEREARRGSERESVITDCGRVEPFIPASVRESPELMMCFDKVQYLKPVKLTPARLAGECEPEGNIGGQKAYVPLPIVEHSLEERYAMLKEIRELKRVGTPEALKRVESLRCQFLY